MPPLDERSTGASPFTLVRGGDVYSPRPLGRQTVLIVADRIAWIGPDDELPDEFRRLGPSWLREIDASGCLILPGLVDPHEHTIGAGGEQGYASRTTEVTADELLACGITTSIGCLGTDVTTRHLTTLLAKTRQLDEAGVSAFMLTGGFTVPPKTITGSVEDDLVIVDKIIGVGEVAISDTRACDPTLVELARLITQAQRGASLAGKSGTVLFHVGDGKQRLQVLNELLDQHDVAPTAMIADHVNRSPEHVQQAVHLARRGVRVCMDTVDEDLPRWIRLYRAAGGSMSTLNICSDAHTAGGDVTKLVRGLFESVGDGMPLDEVLPAFTTNTADVWHLQHKGRLATGCDADLLLVDAQSLRVEGVLARGQLRSETVAGAFA